MLRYVKFDLLQRSIIEFCCSRVIFSNVNIPVSDDSLLFDNDFIDQKIKRYKRSGKEHTDILHGICGKCDGFGFFDWVTHIRTEDGVDEDPIFRSDLSKPIQIKNENPIETVYAHVSGDRLYVYYISHLEDDPLIYRCDQCHGIGIDHDFGRYAKKCKPEDLINIKPSPIKAPPKISDISWFKKVTRYLKVLFIIGRLYARDYTNRKLYSNRRKPFHPNP